MLSCDVAATRVPDCVFLSILALQFTKRYSEREKAMKKK